LNVLDIPAFDSIGKARSRIPVPAHSDIPFSAGVLKILYKPWLMTVGTEIKEPDARDKPALPARAAPQHVLGIHASAAVNRRDRLDHFNTGKFFRPFIPPFV